MKIQNIILALILLIASSGNSDGTPLLKQMKGSDLVNAARMVLDDSFTPPTTEEKLISLYTLGFIEGVLASGIQKEMTQGEHKSRFELGEEAEIGVLKLILEYVEGSTTLLDAEGPPLLHALLCIRYGSTPEVRSKGTKILWGLSAKEAQDLINALAQSHSEEVEENTPGQSAASSESDTGNRDEPEAERRSR